MTHTLTYIIYIILALITIQVVGRILYRAGKVFLAEIFIGDMEAYIAPINTLLLIGFHLINSGMILLSISTSGTIETLDDSIGFITTKLGAVYLILGGMHAFNLITFRVVQQRIKTINN